jgi:hypothetical protein
MSASLFRGGAFLSTIPGDVETRCRTETPIPAGKRGGSGGLFTFGKIARLVEWFIVCKFISS